ncbi:phosphate ABC transporter, inner membrane subunit PstA [Desulfotomaculum nigrificans CO-1-SRB]|uniref:Phosphate transport system permease protein PstA n=1 Tax=Desulfotomaculum nigrificans (strain DSM 14880 / VKM B-2319 / CO-1-SRB) TaxID=868595 RepID=F6B6T5_DESCC|nr:phosphate ABC transporter permease PstA [Desulfotomaculum nigrificans]AEF93260.1 phosphate ABC transporter, inner membrane subunit PstA [Desulfotomaculum nigrificans CO-1-SRB]
MRAQTADKLATAFFYAGAGLVVIILVGLIGYILYHGASSIDWSFITSPPQNLSPGGGVGPQIFNSFYLLFLTMLITVPVGLLAGIYLAEFAKPGKVTESIRLSIETLTSLPSIVVGLFGLLIFVNLTGWGYSLMSGALALTVINLPLMVRISEEAIRNVPVELREGSLALGATRWQTVWKVVIPSAFLSILTGTIITAGRVFGEAAALLFTAGMSSPPLNFNQWDILSPASPWNPFRPAETLAVHIWKVNSESLIPDVRRVADGSAAILVLVVLLFNITARWLGRRIHKKLTAQ